MFTSICYTSNAMHSKISATKNGNSIPSFHLLYLQLPPWVTLAQGGDSRRHRLWLQTQGTRQPIQVHGTRATPTHPTPPQYSYSTSLNEGHKDLAGILIAIHHLKDPLHPRSREIPVQLFCPHTSVTSVVSHRQRWRCAHI